MWRGGRVVDGARLESVYTATYRGFESLSLRQPKLSDLSLNKYNSKRSHGTLPFLVCLFIIEQEQNAKRSFCVST